jgi:hypothetical protein
MPLTQPAQWARAQFGQANLPHSVQPFAPRVHKVVGIATNASGPVMSAREGCAPDAADWLAWHLLTTEAVTTSEQASKIIGDDELRWLIEDYHKIWKSVGTRVEG